MEGKSGVGVGEVAGAGAGAGACDGGLWELSWGVDVGSQAPSEHSPALPVLSHIW